MGILNVIGNVKGQGKGKKQNGNNISDTNVCRHKWRVKSSSPEYILEQLLKEMNVGKDFQPPVMQDLKKEIMERCEHKINGIPYNDPDLEEKRRRIFKIELSKWRLDTDSIITSIKGEETETTGALRRITYGPNTITTEESQYSLISGSTRQMQRVATTTYTFSDGSESIAKCEHKIAQRNDVPLNKNRSPYCLDFFDKCKGIAFDKNEEITLERDTADPSKGELVFIKYSRGEEEKKEGEFDLLLRGLDEMIKNGVPELTAEEYPVK